MQTTAVQRERAFDRTDARNTLGVMTSDTDREIRKPGTEDARLIPNTVALDATIDDVMQQRLDDCASRGHVWLNAATRELCIHCGSAWGPTG
jgi:hypothetical protein